MSIKTRLLLSYIAMTVIPVVLFAMIAAALASVFFKEMGGAEGGGKIPAFWAASSQRSELVAGVKFMAQADPDRFNDSTFLKQTEEQLNHLQAGLILVKNGRILFASSLLADADRDHQLQELQNAKLRSRWGSLVGGRYSVEKADIAFSDHQSGTVYLLSDVKPFADDAKRFFPALVLVLLIVVALTNGILTLAVSRSLIKPLYALKLAAEQIKGGDLSHQVNLNRKDEIGELGAAFEEMRSRLNDSIQLQLQYEENRKELVSNISHDLKTPIAGIKACVEGIRDGIADTEAKREKYISMIAKKTDDMDRLIEELFLFSKLDLKRLPFELETTELAAYLRDCTEELRSDPRMQGVEVSFGYAGDGPVYVTADRKKLHRVITNIVDNSLKYRDKANPEIRLELFDGLQEAKVKIKDNGSGIDSSALAYIFDRFYRVEPSRNSANGGSGLGLAIVKQMIEGQGGKVWAESRAGEGTEIYFTLPKIKNGGEQI